MNRAFHPIENPEQDTRAHDESCIGTITGKLAQVDAGNRAHKFQLTNSLFSAAANFPPELREDMQRALGRRVSARGKCFYKPGASFPHKIDVREMEILPPSDDAPTFQDLYGIAPDATGGKSSEDFVRELRGEWGAREKKLYGGK